MSAVDSGQAIVKWICHYCVFLHYPVAADHLHTSGAHLGIVFSSLHVIIIKENEFSLKSFCHLVHVLYIFSYLYLSSQSQAVKAVEREPYDGEVVEVLNSGRRDYGTLDLDTPTRPSTRHGGVRDLQESSFSLSGEVTICLFSLFKLLLK